MKTVFLILAAAIHLAAVEYPPDATLNTTVMPALSRPGYLSPIIDPAFGTTVVRVSDQGSPFNSSEPRLSHVYAKNQVWNSDGTRVMLNWSYPAAVLDGNTFAFRRWVNQPSESMWMNTDPRYTIGASGNSLVRFDVDNNTTSILKTFSEYGSITMGDYEGNLSQDDKWMVMIGTSGSNREIFVYDMVNQAVTARLNFGSGPINNATVSQSGTYVVVQWNVNGSGSRQGTELFNRSFTSLGHLSPRGGTHYDLGYDTSGREVIVITADNSSALTMRRLSDLVATELIPASKMSYNIHVSCRNLNRPGWTYISEFRGDVDIITANTQLTMAVKLDGSGTVENFAHEHRSSVEAYERSAMSVPNRDGSKVMFASDWMDGSGPIYAYVAYQAPSGNNAAPTVSLSAPASGVPGTALALSAMAADSDGSIAKVEFFVGSTLISSDTTSPYSASWTPSTAGSFQLTAVATDNLGASTTSAATTVTVTAPSVLPAGWAAQDVGTVAAAGTTTESSGTWTLGGSGADIWDTADGFRFAYLQISGDVRITARVTAQSNTNAWAKAGVMIRETLTAGSSHFLTNLTPANGIWCTRRTTTGGSSVSTGGPMAAAPYWVRLERTGNVLIGSVSADGSTWTEIYRETVTLAAAIKVGLAVTSHADGQLSTATFTNVSVVTPAANLAPTVSAGPDRAITQPANASLNGTVSDDGLPNGTLTQGWSTDSGPGTVTFANRAAADTTATFSAAGTYVLRLTASDGSLDASDTMTVTVAEPASVPTITLSSTSVALGGQVTVTVSGGPGNPADWVGLFDAATSAGASEVPGYWMYLNGTQSQPSTGRASATLVFAMPMTAGSYVFRFAPNDAYTPVLAATATVTVQAAGLPSGWTAQDIGSVAAGGTVSENAGTWTVSGSGADIWNTADEFQFAWRQVTGDVQITARVTGIDNTDPWAKAGVMLRQSLAAGSRQVSTVLTPANGVSYQRRTSTNGASAYTAGARTVAPYWVRIERVGNLVTSSSSADGSTWKVIRTQTVTLGTSIYVGLAVTSHNDGQLCTATFTNVQLVGVAAAAN